MVDTKCLESVKDFLSEEAILEREHLFRNIKNPDSYFEAIIQELENEVSQRLLENS